MWELHVRLSHILFILRTSAAHLYKYIYCTAMLLHVFRTHGSFFYDVPQCDRENRHRRGHKQGIFLFAPDTWQTYYIYCTIPVPTSVSNRSKSVYEPLLGKDPTSVQIDLPTGAKLFPPSSCKLRVCRDIYIPRQPNQQTFFYSTSYALKVCTWINLVGTAQ